jgi:tetratricopeptide (TPR) repeat protein
MYSIKYFALLIFLSLLTACTGGTRPTTEEAPADAQIPITDALSVSPEQKHLYREAITALNANQLDTAENLLKQFNRQKTDFAGPLANLGLIYFKQNKLEQAQEMLKQALEKNPQQPQALNLMGQIAYENGQAKEAEQWYLKAIASKEDYANAHYNLALLYDIFFQDIARAVEHYRRYQELTQFSDKDTANWLEQLENSLKGG